MTKQSAKPRTREQASMDTSRRASAPLEVVFADLHGPYPEASFGGYRFAAVFVDSLELWICARDAHTLEA